MGWYNTILPSSPLASSYSGFPADMDSWTCSMWKAYYQRNKTALGKDKAMEIIGIDTDRVGAFSTAKNTCIFDCDWIAYFKGEGLTDTSFVTSIYCGSYNVVKTAENTTKVASNVTDVFANNKLMSAALIGGLLYVGYRVLK